MKNVRYPATVGVGLDFDVSVWSSVDPAQIPRGENFSLKASADNGSYGTVEASHENGTHPSASEIVLRAKPTEKGRFVVPVNEIDRVKAVVREEMENAAHFSVPLKADIGIGKNWLEAH